MIRKLLVLSVLSSVMFATDFAVTSTADSGAGTLREALNSIEEGDTITFDDISGTIQLASALPAIVIDTTITGPATGSVTINGSASYQIFDVNSWTTITNLSLANYDTSTAGSAILVGSDATLVLDTVSIPHCDSCEAPVLVQENGLIMSNNMTFSSPGSSGVDVFFQDGAAAIFGLDDQVQTQIWIGTSGTGVIYKEGDGVLDLKAASSVAMNAVADEGTLLFSDTSTETFAVLANGTFEGKPTVGYLGSYGIIETGSGFGTIDITQGGYFQDTTGTLILKINASGSTDLVQAPGSGQIGGNLIIQLQPGTYTASTTYTLLTCDGGFNAEFDNAYFDIPGQGLQSISNASLTYGTTDVVLEITSTFVVDPPENVNIATNHLQKPASPISRLFKWVMKHEEKPRENVNRFLHVYLEHLKKRIHR